MKSLQNNEILDELALDLIRYHYTDNNDKFTETARKIANELEKEGEEKLANYVEALLNETTCWVPQ